jgi:putative endonuclease
MDIAHPTDKQHKGNQAETLAQRHLERQGFSLVTRNFSCKTGEIDLIMQDREMLVFVEVRYRKETGLGSPLETITSAKQRKLNRAAQFFLQQHYGNRWPPCRFDAVGISGELDASPTIEWVANAF